MSFSTREYFGVTVPNILFIVVVFVRVGVICFYCLLPSANGREVHESFGSGFDEAVVAVITGGVVESVVPFLLVRGQFLEIDVFA